MITLRPSSGLRIMRARIGHDDVIEYRAAHNSGEVRPFKAQVEAVLKAGERKVTVPYSTANSLGVQQSRLECGRIYALP